MRHQVRLADRRVARVVRRRAELAGQELFQYADADGTVHRIDSADVNAWLAETADVRVTAKDFRTWRGSLLALALTLAACADGAPACWAQDVLKGVARRPGNTPAVCKKAYIHSRVLALGDALVTTLRAPPCAASREPAATGPSQRLADSAQIRAA